jgi:hypothetical protein
MRNASVGPDMEYTNLSAMTPVSVRLSGKMRILDELPNARVTPWQICPCYCPARPWAGLFKATGDRYYD